MTRPTLVTSRIYPLILENIFRIPLNFSGLFKIPLKKSENDFSTGDDHLQNLPSIIFKPFFKDSRTNKEIAGKEKEDL